MNHFIHSSIYQQNWIVPRSVMCTLFWTGVILVFTGMILLVTSKHKGPLKGPMYKSWGGVLLGLGLCLLLICLILCIHAYCIMAADAASSSSSDETGHPSPIAAIDPSAHDLKARPNPLFQIGGTSLTDYHQSLDAAKRTGTGLCSNSSQLQQQVNGRKPLSMAELIPPPKYGISVAKAPTHTVRFFLSNETEADETSSNHVTDKESEGRPDRPQKIPSKTTINATSSSDSGGNISALSIDPNGHRSNLEGWPEMVEQNHKMAAAAAAETRAPTVGKQLVSECLFLDRTANFISSDCSDSIMSVETIVPGTLQRNITDQTLIRPRYDVQDQDPPEKTNAGQTVAASQRPMTFLDQPPLYSLLSAYPRGALASHVLSEQMPQYSYSKTRPQHQEQQQQQQQLWNQQRNCSSETSPSSPESPEITEYCEDQNTSSPVTRLLHCSSHKPPLSQTAAASTTLSRHHQRPVGQSITRTFGPSTVTVTPLGKSIETSDSFTTATHGGEETGLPKSQIVNRGAKEEEEREGQMPYHQYPKIPKEFIQDTLSGFQIKPGSTEREDNFTSDEGVERHKFLTANKRKHTDLEISTSSNSRRYMDASHSPSRNTPPSVLETTESKATVYDNVQYFHM